MSAHALADMALAAPLSERVSLARTLLARIETRRIAHGHAPVRSTPPRYDELSSRLASGRSLHEVVQAARRITGYV